MANQMIFTALADPTRRTLFEHLRAGAQTVGQLSASQPVSRPAVSQHLRVLHDAGLVEVSPQGTRRFYSIRRAGLNELRDYLDSFWSDVLTAYSNEIERTVSGRKNVGSNQEDD